ncbi:MAG: KamA family radical SAM protein [bacterium]|jgi:KamA family protein
MDKFYSAAERKRVESHPQGVKYIKDVGKVYTIPEERRARLAEVQEKYAFRANDYYLSLIDWNDPKDPIMRIVIPDEDELIEDGILDPSDEASITVAPGCEHKYSNTALLLCNDICGSFCRFCFRKRLFIHGNDEAKKDVSPGIEYIRNHPEIDNVLLTGGDPLLLSTKKLRTIVEQVMSIPHVKVLRIGSKMPAFNPYRITDDPELDALLREVNENDCQVYIMAHFNHSRELTEEATEAIWHLRRAGCRVHNQTPLLAGINDNPDVLCALANRLSYIGVTPYYLFQNRPIAGNKAFKVPLMRGSRIFEQAKRRMSGVAKMQRYVMSHRLGKVEIVGVENGRIYLRFHQSKFPENEGRFFSCPVNEDAYWLDDLDLPQDIRQF